MIGTIYNTAMILAGSAAGSIFRKGLKEKYRVVVMMTSRELDVMLWK